MPFRRSLSYPASPALHPLPHGRHHRRLHRYDLRPDRIHPIPGKWMYRPFPSVHKQHTLLRQRNRCRNCSPHRSKWYSPALRCPVPPQATPVVLQVIPSVVPPLPVLRPPAPAPHSLPHQLRCSPLRWSKQLSFRPSDSSENIPPRSRIPRLPPAGSKRTVSYNSILLSLSFSPLLPQRQADIPSPAAFAYYRKAVHRSSFYVLPA